MNTELSVENIHLQSFISQITKKASQLLIWARAAVFCFSTLARRQLMYPRPPIRVTTVLGASSTLLLGWLPLPNLTTCVVVVVVTVAKEPSEAGPDEAVEADAPGVGIAPPPGIEAGPVMTELEADEEGAPFDWKLALRLMLGDGLSEPASLELVVWLEELLDSTLQEDMSNDLGLDVFILTLRSRVLTLKTKVTVMFL